MALEESGSIKALTPRNSIVTNTLSIESRNGA